MITSPPSPGTLVRLCPVRWDGQVVLVIPPRGFTDTDFMGRPYVWVLAHVFHGGASALQIPLSNLSEVIDAAA
jgi:hypothetical protein